MAQKAPSSIPEGMHSVTPSMWFNGNCRQAIEHYKKALKAELLGDIVPSPDGKAVWHAMIKIGNSTIMVADAMPDSWEKGPVGSTSVGLWVYTDNCDDLYNNAVKHGCEIVMPMADMFWGDRMGKLKDPYGHTWVIAANQWIYTPEEMQEKQNEMMANMQGS